MRWRALLAPGNRRARVETLAESLTAEDRPRVTAERRRLEAMVAPGGDSPGPERSLPRGMPDEDLVNALAQYLELEPVEKQALLEREGLLARCHSLIELLEMKVIVAQNKWGGEH